MQRQHTAQDAGNATGEEHPAIVSIMDQLWRVESYFHALDLMALGLQGDDGDGFARVLEDAATALSETRDALAMWQGVSADAR